jgi:4-hydroxybenzoate polyprenyltransferase
MFGIKDAIWVCFLFGAFLACLWLATESTRTMTLVCVKVISDRDGLAQALEQCK